MNLPNSHLYIDIFNEIYLLIAVISTEGIVLDANVTLVQQSGTDKNEIIGQAYWELGCWIHSDEMQNKILFSIEESALTESTVRFEAQYKDFQGNINDIDLHIKPMLDQNNEVISFLASGYNVTELVATRKSLSERERQMNALFEFSNEGFFFNALPNGLDFTELETHTILNDLIKYQKITRMNPSIKRILGFEDHSDAVPSRLYELLKIPGKHYRNYVSQLIETGVCQFEHALIDAAGVPKIIEVFMAIIQSNLTTFGSFGVVRDLTQQRQYEAELKFYAFKDVLTGINNRRTFFSLALEYFNLEQHAGTVCMMDIDHFKRVNDTYGHDTGDVVLKEFAQKIATSFDEKGIVCRYGGEEFAILIQGLSVEDALILVETFRKNIETIQFLAPDQTPFYISVSIGLARINETDLSIEQGITKADKALYASKTNGRNQTTIAKE